MHSVFRDPVSGLTHLGGALFSIAALCVLVVQAALHGGIWHMVSFSIFGVTLLLMFSSSALYHLLHAPEHVILWLKRIDHIAIFLLIAGTYTPFCLLPLHGTLGWTLFAAVWGLAGAGIFLKIFWISAPRWLSTLIFLGMGWLIVLAAGPAQELVPEGALLWVFYGGLAYSAGAVIYALKWPDPWPKWFGFHEIWHLFVMAGAFCHFYAIAMFLPQVVVPAS